MNEDLQSIAAQQLNDFAQFLAYQPTWLLRRFLQVPFRKLCFFTGNQFGKTTMCIFNYVLRVLGSHPVPQKNVLYFNCKNGHNFGRPSPWPGMEFYKRLGDGECYWSGPETKMFPRVTTFPMDLKCPQCGEKIIVHKRNSTTFRLLSENLPGDKEGSGVESAEIRNRTYPELKKWLPPFLIKRDITFRNMAMLVKDPNDGCKFGEGPNAINYKGREIVFEFMSYSQSAQAGAGQQRLSIYADEEPPWANYEEQLPRLLAENGDFLLGLTPANRTSWTFDELFEKAKLYIRTPCICEFYNRSGDSDKATTVEWTTTETDIAVFQAATDDNPTLNKEIIGDILSYEDEDTEATRRYGIHRQSTGRIFKDFDHRIHSIDPDVHFPHGIPKFWIHGRGIDVHPKTPWACGCAALSPQDELFIWLADSLSPDKLTTAEIMSHFYGGCMDYLFDLSLCDPLAESIKKDHISVLDDMNRLSIELKRSGIGTGGYWHTWNTKGEYGRDQIKARLKNSRIVGRPFNNSIIEDGRQRTLPTIWIFNTCKHAIEHMQRWSWAQWSDNQSLTTKDDKNEPQQKYSHFNMVWEALLKHPNFKPRRMSYQPEQKLGRQYFKASRR